MVMINGVNFSDPQTGHHSLNIPVDITQIERVEVLHGPGAWSQGSVAYAGAINIITKKPVKKDLQASLSGGRKGLFSRLCQYWVCPRLHIQAVANFRTGGR
jgi:iron complex outermembrane receptor protein